MVLPLSGIGDRLAHGLVGVQAVGMLGESRVVMGAWKRALAPLRRHSRRSTGGRESQSVGVQGGRRA